MHFIDLMDKPNPLSVEATAAADPSPFVSLSHAGRLSLEIDGARETYFILTRNASCPWTILRLEQDRLSANFQGNPLWPGKALERYPNLRRYFGLERTATDHACLMPDSSTINEKLRALMPGGGSLPPMRFGYQSVDSYPSVHSGKISDRVFVDTFIDSGRLPFGHHLDRDSVHDWSYHFVTLLFPELLENIRLTLLAIRDQIDVFSGETLYDWNYYGHTLDARGNTIGSPRRERLSHPDAIYRQMAITLDVATAKVVQVLIMEGNGKLDPQGHELQLLRTYLGGVTMDSLKSILWMEAGLEQLLRPMKQPAGYVHRDDPLAYLHDRLAELDERAAGLNRPGASGKRYTAFTEALYRVTAGA